MEPAWRPQSVGLPIRTVRAPSAAGRGPRLAWLGLAPAAMLAFALWSLRPLATPTAPGGVIRNAMAASAPVDTPGGPAAVPPSGLDLTRAETANAARQLAASVPGTPPWDTTVVRAAARESGLPAALVAAVIYAESRGDPRAVSPTGAIGLMQLEPATAAALGVRNLFDPRQNVEGGSHYLATWLAAYGGRGCVSDPDTCPRAFSLALAAYNAGPGAVRRYGGIPPYPATERYVREVEAVYHAYLSSS